MAHHRVKIDKDVINQAFDAAEAGAPGRDIWADTEQRGLVLERRGRTVAWWLKTRSATRKIGPAGRGYKGTHISPRDARSQAATMLSDLKSAPDPVRDSVEPEHQPCWTWRELLSEHIENLNGVRVKGVRVKLANEGTIRDVRTVFGLNSNNEFVVKKRPSLEAWQDKRVDDMTAADLVQAQLGIKTRRPREKLVAYYKTMMDWANSNSHKSGLRAAAPWWPFAEPIDPSTEEVEDMLARKARRDKAQRHTTVEHIGELLVRHEEFCSGRERGNERIGPGVRCGIWWVMLTANRRGATTMLERDCISWTSPIVPDGWGTAYWDEGSMKSKVSFMIPVPPIGLRVLWIAQHDWRATVTNIHQTTRWAFASTQRQPRHVDKRIGPGRHDISTDPGSLSAHLCRLRGTRNGQRDAINNLDGLPDVWLHLVRTVASNYLTDCPGVSDGAISAFLSHKMKGDSRQSSERPSEEQMSPTTAKFYNTSQRIPAKTDAVKAWTEGLMTAYEKAGGRLPEPALPTHPTATLPPRPW